MATPKITTRLAVSLAKTDANTPKLEQGEATTSQIHARVITKSGLSAQTLKQFSGSGDKMDIPDLVAEMKKAGDEVVAGDLSRVERMLTNQLLTLDMLFNNLAQRSGHQDTFKGIEVLMRLALKAQAQSRSTAEAIALLKNPPPFIQQTNVSTGPQQVNNTYSSSASEDGQCAGAGKIKSSPNKLLEARHEQWLDIGAQATAGRACSLVETVGAVHRPDHA
jgi:hypothetical protein